MACYLGTSFVFTHGDEGEELILDVNVPPAQIEQLIAALRRDPNTTVQLSARVRAFTNEMDDALKEWYHPQDILVEDANPATIESWSFTSAINPTAPQAIAAESSDDEDDGDAPSTPQPAPVQPAPDFSALARSLNRLATVLWVAEILLALKTLFS